jgi:PAS domain-containing protein
MPNNIPSNKKKSVINHNIPAMFALAGSLFLCCLSFIQKIIAGFNPFLLKAYYIPFIFGGLSGLIIGFYINKLKRSAKELKEGEELFRVINTTALDAVILMDDSGKTVLFDPAAEKMFGYTEDEITGQWGLDN